MPIYEVALIDAFSFRDSVKRKSLLSKLRGFADAKPDEIPDTDLSSYLWSGALRLHPGISSWEEIESVKEYGVLLLAAISVADFRMMASAQYFPITSRVGSTDPSVRVRSNVEIKAALMKQFDAYMEQSGISSGNEILVGELFKRDAIGDVLIPIDTSPSPPKLTLTLLAQTATEISIGWNNPGIADFDSYTIYMSTSPNIEDKTRYAEEFNTGVRSDASGVLCIPTQWDIAARLGGLTTGTTYWIVVVCQNINSKVSVSNEISVTL